MPVGLGNNAVTGEMRIYWTWTLIPELRALPIDARRALLREARRRKWKNPAYGLLCLSNCTAFVALISAPIYFLQIQCESDAVIAADTAGYAVFLLVVGLFSHGINTLLRRAIVKMPPEHRVADADSVGSIS